MDNIFKESRPELQGGADQPVLSVGRQGKTGPRGVTSWLKSRIGLVASSWSLHRCSLVLLVSPCGLAAAQQPAKERDKSVEGFGEARRGDVPEGTAEMMTPETDKAIKYGLAWLARTQNPDGSFGSGTYRGNIAVTSLAGLAFMARARARAAVPTVTRSTRPWST